MTNNGFLSKSFDISGTRSHAVETPVEALTRGRVILFRDPINADFAKRTPEIGVISSIFHAKRGEVREAVVMTICPLTIQSKGNFTPNTDDFWVIDRAAEIAEMKLGTKWNFRLGLGLVVRPDLERTDVQRVIPIADDVLNPGGTPGTVMAYGRVPLSLQAKMETHLERRFKLHGDLARQLIYDVKRAAQNRDNLAELSRNTEDFTVRPSTGFGVERFRAGPKIEQP